MLTLNVCSDTGVNKETVFPIKLMPALLFDVLLTIDASMEGVG